MSKIEQDGPCGHDDCQQPGRCDGRHCLAFPGTIRLEPDEIEENERKARIAAHVAYFLRQAKYWQNFGRLGQQHLEQLQALRPEVEIFGVDKKLRDKIDRQMAANRMRHGTARDYMEMARIVNETGWYGELD